MFYDYGYHPVIPGETASLADEDAMIETVSVYVGDEVVGADGIRSRWKWACVRPERLSQRHFAESTTSIKRSDGSDGGQFPASCQFDLVGRHPADSGRFSLLGSAPSPETPGSKYLIDARGLISLNEQTVSGGASQLY